MRGEAEVEVTESLIHDFRDVAQRYALLYEFARSARPGGEA
jgi:hypothetical protein